jgi:hypothetical protein
MKRDSNYGRMDAIWALHMAAYEGFRPKLLDIANLLKAVATGILRRTQ